jgi:hypothetical protein
MKNPQILPVDSLQQLLEVELLTTKYLELQHLEQQLPAVYYAMISLWLESKPKTLTATQLQQLSADNIINSIPANQIGWQQLCCRTSPKASEVIEPIDKVAEVVFLLKDNQLLLLYLRLLPRDFVVAAQQQSNDLLSIYTQLLTDVVNKLSGIGTKYRCDQLVCDIYNPQLQQLFTTVGFTSLPEYHCSNPVMSATRMMLPL